MSNGIEAAPMRAKRADRQGAQVFVLGSAIRPHPSSWVLPEGARDDDKGLWIWFTRLTIGEIKKCLEKSANGNVAAIEQMQSSLLSCQVARYGVSTCIACDGKGHTLDDEGERKTCLECDGIGQIGAPEAPKDDAWINFPVMEKDSVCNALQGEPFDIIASMWARAFAVKAEHASVANKSFRLITG